MASPKDKPSLTGYLFGRQFLTTLFLMLVITIAYYFAYNSETTETMTQVNAPIPACAASVKAAAICSVTPRVFIPGRVVEIQLFEPAGSDLDFKTLRLRLGETVFSDLAPEPVGADKLSYRLPDARSDSTQDPSAVKMASLVGSPALDGLRPMQLALRGPSGDILAAPDPKI